MKSVNSDFAKSFFDLLVKILLGLAAAVVTITGFAFERSVSIYFLINASIMFVGCIIYRLLKKWITIFLFGLLKDNDHTDTTIETFLKIFLRLSYKSSLNVLLNALERPNDLKDYNKIANPHIIPFYIGTYPLLFWTAVLQMILFITSIFLKGWSII